MPAFKKSVIGIWIIEELLNVDEEGLLEGAGISRLLSNVEKSQSTSLISFTNTSFGTSIGNSGSENSVSCVVYSDTGAGADRLLLFCIDNLNLLFLLLICPGSPLNLEWVSVPDECRLGLDFLTIRLATTCVLYLAVSWWSGPKIQRLPMPCNAASIRQVSPLLEPASSGFGDKTDLLLSSTATGWKDFY